MYDSQDSGDFITIGYFNTQFAEKSDQNNWKEI